MVELERDGDVWVLTMDDGENRFNRSSIDELIDAVLTVAASDGPCALVTTGSGKFYSNGLDLDWLMAGGPATEGFIDDVYRLFGLVLGLDCYTVAAVNGHAFAGGGMLAVAHDVVVMRADRGYWCLPEVDLGLPLAVPMFEVVASKVPKATMAEAALTGRRYSGPEAVAAGIVAAAVPADDVLPQAMALAASMAGKSRSVLAEHKRLLHGPALAACGVL